MVELIATGKSHHVCASLNFMMCLSYTHSYTEHVLIVLHSLASNYCVAAGWIPWEYLNGVIGRTKDLSLLHWAYQHVHSLGQVKWPWLRMRVVKVLDSRSVTDVVLKSTAYDLRHDRYWIAFKRSMMILTWSFEPNWTKSSWSLSHKIHLNATLMLDWFRCPKIQHIRYL